MKHIMQTLLMEKVRLIKIFYGIAIFTLELKTYILKRNYILYSTHVFKNNCNIEHTINLIIYL